MISSSPVERTDFPQRTHFIEDLLETVGQTVKVAGWVSRRRDLGSVIFIDLRDRTGTLQLVFNRDLGTPEEMMQLADTLRNEFVIAVTGCLVERDKQTINPKIATGHIELVVKEVQLVNRAKNPPFYIQEGIEVDEQVRLKYRYLDLRRPEMQRTLRLRHHVFSAFREFLNQHDFLEIETPMLTRSTPEGARDYIVPSRLQHGEFYALPQSPQIFKQLLMVAGYERYYQIARCFRDEDLRADRQPEFTQLDIETSFLPMDDLLKMMEEMFAYVFAKVLGVNLTLPMKRLTYADAMRLYGSDKPDLRFSMAMVDVETFARESSLEPFHKALDNGGIVTALVVPGCAAYSRKQLDELTQFVKDYGLSGLATVAWQSEGIKSSIQKFVTPEQLTRLMDTVQAKQGDLVLIAAGKEKTVRQAMGALRLKLGRDLSLIDEGAYCFLWVVDFPLFSYDEELGRYVAEHHPFTMPKREDLHLLENHPEHVRAQAYDLVLNGYELSSGSMRIYQRDLQERMFRALGFSEDEARKQFGFLLDAFEYGTPPHGGIAFGLDRLVMLMAGGKSLRDCIAFPKTASATDLMMDAPSPATPEQLATLGISLRKTVK
ncbi:aspartate--tRNA ligase [Alicyclobacillus tolerans]|uniref:aspartate--tRNA ligase n=1 Tax=Alicyclobacillus tolerans TaxID=90970 RepID=UPI003B80F1D4